MSEIRTTPKSELKGIWISDSFLGFKTEGCAFTFGYSNRPCSDVQFAVWKSDSCLNSKQCKDRMQPKGPNNEQVQYPLYITSKCCLLCMLQAYKIAVNMCQSKLDIICITDFDSIVYNYFGTCLLAPRSSLLGQFQTMGIPKLGSIYIFSKTLRPTC